MRFLLPTLTILLFAALPAGAVDSRYTFHTTEEIIAYGDFDGDSLLDTVIVGRTGGQIRVGLANPDGSLTWQNARPSGVAGVTAVATGKFLSTSSDQVALTSPEANQVSILDPLAEFTRPTVVNPEGLGPEGLVALELSGLAGNDPARMDLLCLSSSNNPPTTTHQHLLRATATGVTTVSTTSAIPDRARPARASVLAADTERFTVLEPDPGGDVLRVFDAALLPGGASLTSVALPGTGYDYTHAPFIPGFSARSQFICWRPGDGSVKLVRTFANGAFNAPSDHPLGHGPVESIFVVKADSRFGYLAIFDGGTRAILFLVTSSGAMTEEMEITAPAGQRFTGATGHTEGEFVLLSGASSGGPSTRVDRFTHNGTSWEPNGTGALPSLRPATALTNVYLFENEPLVDAGARLVEVLHVPDWTTTFSISGSGNVTIARESFASALTGLSPDGVLSAGTNTDATDILTNQPRDDFSLVNASATAGPLPPAVSISPPGGTYSRSVSPVITSDADAFYRTSPVGSWQPASGIPVTLPGFTLSPATVEYFAEDPVSGLRSPVFSATYEFDGIVDSDGDGVPDFVEVEKGLDPTAGADTDGDGYDDLTEILRGHEPGIPLDHPDPGERLTTAGAFDLTVEFLSHNTSPGGASARPARQSTPVRSWTTDGQLLAQTEVGPGGLATFENLPASPRDGFVVVSTEANFEVLAGGLVVVNEGRELIGLVPVPDAAFDPFEFQPGAGSQTQQTNAWIAQATGYYLGNNQPQVSEQITLEDTLTLLLFERIAGLYLFIRVPGFDPDTFTITPFRDSHLLPVSQEELTGIQTLPGTPAPVILLHDLYDHVSNVVTSGTPASAARMRTLANEIYRISTSLGSGDPGLYPSPVTTLRDILRESPVTGAAGAPNLPGDNNSYEAEVAMTLANLTLANEALGDLVDTLPARTTDDFTAVILEDSFAGPVPVVGKENGSLITELSLFDSSASPFRFPSEFNLPVGTRLQIFAFTDRDLPPQNGAPGIEVVSAEVISYPQPPAVDTDGNLLDDNFEDYYFPGGGADPFADDDGDGYTNLQESLEMTNPLSNGSTPATPPFPPRMPQIEISPLPSDEYLLSVPFPAAYADQIRFVLQESDTLTGFIMSGTEAVPDGSGRYELTVPRPPADLSSYFRFELRLR